MNASSWRKIGWKGQQKAKNQKHGFPEKATVQREGISFNGFVKVEYVL